MCGGVKVPLGIQATAVIQDNDEPFMLFARSSISKTPIRIANPPGLIDPTYRGELIVAVDNNSDDSYTITAGMKLVQAVGFHGGPINTVLTETLDETVRGEGGFGSTDDLTSSPVITRETKVDDATKLVNRIGIDVGGVINRFDNDNV